MNIYLAGPMAGLDYTEATGWRMKVYEDLTAEGITCFSPLRWKEWLNSGKKISRKAKKNATHPMGTSKGIMTRDFFDVKQSDVIFANFLGSGDNISMGTCMEIAWAWAFQKPTVVVGEADNPHMVHPMMTEAINFATTDLEEGIEIAKSILIPR